MLVQVERSQGTFIQAKKFYETEIEISICSSGEWDSNSYFN